jgi:homocysteine S-methyltransferase
MTPVILDGATGTEIERRGGPLRAPLWSAQALLDAPALVREIHREYLEAGAQVLTTNSFRTHARNLAAAGLAGRAAELTTLSVHLACAAREQYTRTHPAGAQVRIAGAISPLEDCFRPADSPGRDAGPEHREIAQQLVAAGADLLLIETMGRIDEARAAVAAAQGLGRPVWLAVVARADGRMLAGEALHDLVAALADLELHALLLNCTDLGHLGVALPALCAAAAARPALWLGAYPHTGHQDPERGWQTHASTADEFADALAAWSARLPQLRLLGGCCGSTPAWISALAARLHPDAASRASAFARSRVGIRYSRPRDPHRLAQPSHLPPTSAGGRGRGEERRLRRLRRQREHRRRHRHDR